ncbi:MAG TPA: hypothetical protein VHU13_07995 [Solirubrobacteraceae bacterium]|jgi:hypothetical protein|nr:hypothetical protein [Solirubrobacteraceae bacterium]
MLARGGAARRTAWVASARNLAIPALAVVFAIATFGASAAHAVSQSSGKVAIIDGGGSEDVGSLQLSGSLAGDPADSFEAFSFTVLSQESISPPVLAEYDTVLLNQVFTTSLTTEQEQALSKFVTLGGKLIIHDADGTEGNDYSWLPVPAASGFSCQNCGNTNGEARVVENNTLVSNDPTSPYYVDVEEFPGNTDAVGDANVLLTEDTQWNPDVEATNSQNVGGAVHAYASDGGLIVFNGFDQDALGSSLFPSGQDWLDKLWYQELAQQWDPDNLPHSNPVGGGGGPVVRCGRESLHVGVVSVCANSISGSASQLSASGNVVIDAGIAVGNGPIALDTAAKTLASGGAVPITLLRSHGASIPLGSAAFAIDGNGATDPTSGKTGLARVSLTAANLAAVAGLKVGGLSLSMPLQGSLSMYMDSEQDGGLIAAGTIGLPVVHQLHGSGSLSLGLYASSPSPVTALGGGVSFGAVGLGKGWKFSGLELHYQEPTDTWTASGGLEVPIGSLQLSGSLASGRLDSLSVGIGGQDVPLGDSGFFFTDFGGGVSGMANGPLKVSATTAGFWGVPKAPVEPFYLDNVTISVDFSGAVSLDGAVSFVFKDHSPVHGQLHLQLRFKPFSAVGTASADADLPGVSLKAHGGAGFTAKHFTATASGDLRIFALSGHGEAVTSDAGLGASGKLCVLFFCETLAFAGTWKQIQSFDLPAIVGGEPDKLITVSGVSAAGQTRSVRVPGGRSLLLISVRAITGAPRVRLRAPNGRVFDSALRSASVAFASQPNFGLTTIAVPHPRAGRWRISTATSTGAIQVAAQTVRPMRLVHADMVAPTGSSRHPLSTHARVLLRWSSRGLPSGVRLFIVRRSRAHQIDVGVAHGLRANGSYEVPVSRLAVGPNFFSVVATLHGVPFQHANFPGVAWRTSPPKHAKKHRRHR